MATAMPIVDGVIFIGTLVDAMDNAGVTALTTAAKLVNYLRPVIVSSFVLYIMLWGWAMVNGMISEVVMDGVTRILKLGIVMGLVLGFGLTGNDQTLYTQFVYDFVWNGPETMFQFLTGHTTETISVVSMAASFLYTLGFDYFQEGIKMGTDQIDLVMFGLGSITVLAGTMLAATVITTLVFAKFMLSILISVGPVFIVLFLFNGTRRLFEAWLGQLISNVILIVLFGLAVNLIMGVLWDVLKTHFVAYLTGRVIDVVTGILFGGPTTTAPSPVQGLGIVMVTYVCHLFLQKVPPVADAMGRSLSLNLQTGLARK